MDWLTRFVAAVMPGVLPWIYGAIFCAVTFWQVGKGSWIFLQWANDRKAIRKDVDALKSDVVKLQESDKQQAIALAALTETCSYTRKSADETKVLVGGLYKTILASLKEFRKESRRYQRREQPRR